MTEDIKTKLAIQSCIKNLKVVPGIGFLTKKYQCNMAILQCLKVETCQEIYEKISGLPPPIKTLPVFTFW